MPLLSIQNLTVRFHTRNGIVHAVQELNLDIQPAQTVGLAGESGSGKSVTCYAFMGLLPQPPAKIHSGSVFFDGQDLLQLKEKQLRRIRGRRIAMIFQDPMTSLNPFLKISTQLIEPLQIHFGMKKKPALHQAIEALESVGIPQAEKKIHAYPHEFSGGMRQRVMIAMALITKPDLLIADEPTTALDVTVQKQILELIKDLQKKHQTSVLFITHDLAVASELCDEVNILYAGRLVERAPTKELFQSPRHAYTRALLNSLPSAHHSNERLYTIPGTPPSLTTLSEGCTFSPRNTLGNKDKCLQKNPPPFEEISPRHWVQNCPGCLEKGE